MAWEERSTGRAGGESRRRADMAAEEQLAVFLDRYLYARFPDAAAGTEIRRIADRGEQLEGTDVRFIRRDGRVRNIDEKAQLYYLNRDLPTYQQIQMVSIREKEFAKTGTQKIKRHGD